MSTNVDSRRETASLRSKRNRFTHADVRDWIHGRDGGSKDTPIGALPMTFVFSVPASAVSVSKSTRELFAPACRLGRLNRALVRAPAMPDHATAAVDTLRIGGP